MPRKYPATPGLFRLWHMRFNEAGADAPEIPSAQHWCGSVWPGFNEAGADAPEIPNDGLRVLGDQFLASMRPGRMPRKYLVLDAREPGKQVNASMRPGRMPRKYLHTSSSCRFVRCASMRPGRMPRKYPGSYHSMPLPAPGFNEAGADAPEIPMMSTTICSSSLSLQ